MNLDRLKDIVLRHIPGQGPRSARVLTTSTAAIGEGAARALSRRPTPEDVISGFRCIVGRDPTPAQIGDFMGLRTASEVNRTLLGSQEFKDWFVREHVEAREHPDHARARPTVVYLHLPKTGGTTVRAELAKLFAADRVCPVQWNRLHRLSVAELGHYDYYQGHFDYASLRFIPRDNIRIISMFRDPSARLISNWRSLRAAPMPDPSDKGTPPTAAHLLNIEDFFEAEGIRASPYFHNYYLMAFGFSPSWIDGPNPPSLSRADRAAAMELAKHNIRSLAAFGLTERFDQSVQLIFRALGAQVPESIEKLNVTDHKANYDPRYRKVESVAISPRLQEVLAELVEFDNELYRFAVEDFERRCALHGIA